jgi:tetratricopeptide (TPR) repeat protein
MDGRLPSRSARLLFPAVLSACCALVSARTLAAPARDTGGAAAPASAPAPAAAPAPAGEAPSATSMPFAGEMTRCLDLIKAKHYDAARARLEPIVLVNPKWARAHFLLALSYHEEQRYAAARPLFERALALDPDENAIYPFYGWCLYYLGELDLSRKQFETYLKISPGYPDALYALGLIAFDQGDLDTAAKRFTETIARSQAGRDPRTEGKALARMADIDIQNGKLETARDELRRAVALRPDAYEAYFKLSRVLERLGDHEGAERARAMHDMILSQAHPGAVPGGAAVASGAPAGAVAPGGAVAPEDAGDAPGTVRP